MQYRRDVSEALPGVIQAGSSQCRQAEVLLKAGMPTRKQDHQSAEMARQIGEQKLLPRP